MTGPFERGALSGEAVVGLCLTAVIRSEDDVQHVTRPRQVVDDAVYALEGFGMYTRAKLERAAAPDRHPVSRAMTGKAGYGRRGTSQRLRRNIRLPRAAGKGKGKGKGQKQRSTGAINAGYDSEGLNATFKGNVMTSANRSFRHILASSAMMIAFSACMSEANPSPTQHNGGGSIGDKPAPASFPQGATILSAN